MQESGEMYLENILILMREKEGVHAIDVAERMGLSKPSVSRALGLLKAEGCLLVDGDDHIRFTERGLKVAEKIYERHTILTGILMSLGVSEETAVKDACKIEHDISDESFEAIKQHAAERKRHRTS